MRNTHTTSDAVTKKNFWQCPKCRNNVVEEIRLIVDKVKSKRKKKK